MLAQLTYPADVQVRELDFGVLKPWLQRTADEVRLGGDVVALSDGAQLEVYRLGVAHPVSRHVNPGLWDLTPDGKSVALLGKRLELRDSLTGKVRWSVAKPRGAEGVYARGERIFVTTTEGLTLRAQAFQDGRAVGSWLLDKHESALEGFPIRVVSLWVLPGGDLLCLSSGAGSRLTRVTSKGFQVLSTQYTGDHDWLWFSRNGQYCLWGVSIHPGDRTFRIRFGLDGPTVVESAGLADFWEPLDAQGGVLAYGYDQRLEVLDLRQRELTRFNVPGASQATALAFNADRSLTVVMGSASVYRIPAEDWLRSGRKSP